MTEKGVFAVDRGVFDHPMFAPEPYTEREAWLWMVGAAAWKPMRIRAGRAQVQLDRGQCAFATRFMAQKWKWSDSRVRRFLIRLKTDAMVTLETTRETTHITICNYDKYAFGRRTDDAEGDAQTDAPPTHRRRKEEELKKDKKEEIESVEGALRASPPKNVSRGTRLPEAWQPDDDGRKFAVDTLGSNSAARSEFDKFCDHWRAQPGSKGVKTDWPATWRNWCRKAVDMRGNRGPPQRKQQPSFHEIAQSLGGYDDEATHARPGEDEQHSVIDAEPVLDLDGGIPR